MDLAQLAVQGSYPHFRGKEKQKVVCASAVFVETLSERARI